MDKKLEKKEQEKQRLWDEVMNRNKTTANTMQNSADAINTLQEILNKQQKELEDLAKESEKIQAVPNVDNLNTDELAKELQKDYGVADTSGNSFSAIETQLNAEIPGQSDGIHSLIKSFRRPFVMGNNTEIQNVVMISGPKGTGKHYALARAAALLRNANILKSSDISLIDLSRYTSAAQENIFLQDIYSALQSSASIICFENFGTTYPAFLRNITELVSTGTMSLNKRYVLKQGVLTEVQTGLVQNAISSFSAGKKYFFFITTDKPEKAQDVFGTAFTNALNDIVLFQKLDEETTKTVISTTEKEWTQKIETKLRLKPEIDSSLSAYVSAVFDKSTGIDGIHEQYDTFYNSLAQVVLDHDIPDSSKVLCTVKDNVPVAQIGQDSYPLALASDNQKELQAIQKELDQIVGLQEVKDYLQSMQAHEKIQQLRRAQGLKTAPVSRHMIFTGNPGTGKTTIARLLARYLKAIGALSGGQLVEVTRADLVAKYVGQTAPQTMSVIQSAMGGVLFIDEAYSLYRGKDDSFGLECIDTLVKAMEDNRDNLVVVLAGYTKEMETFLTANSGLKSRFSNVMHFPDYTGDELLQIIKIQAKSKGYKISEDALPVLLKFFHDTQAVSADTAGNGRLARNVLEDAILAQAKRLAKEPNGALDELSLSDIQEAIGKN